MDFAYKIWFILSSFLLHNCIGQNVGFEITIRPDGSLQKFRVGKNQILQCEASAAENNQKPALRWEIDDIAMTTTDKNARVRVETTLDGNLMLRVTNVQDGDQGLYKCVGTLGSQIASKIVKVEVVQDLDVLSPSNQFGIFGTDGVVKCEAVAKPVPTITWKFENGNNIENGEKYVIQSDQLFIKNLNDDDTRVYLCDVIVIDTGDSIQFPINYQVVRVPKIDMIPVISPNNPKVGDPEVKITCHATGFPEPTFEFKKGDNLIPEDQVDEKNGILTLQNLKREDEAVYTCVARNKGGFDEKSNLLDVKIPPVIHDIPNVENAVEGGQQKVTCMAEGDPAPTVVWEKQGPDYTKEGIREGGPELIDEGGKDREDAEIKTVGKTMNFAYIRPQDAGTYICTALNVVGNATKTVKFEVRYKPIFDPHFTKVFYGWKGQQANLTCLASANEVANIVWTEIRDNNTVRIKNEAPYTLRTLQTWPEFYLSSSSLLVDVADETSPVFKNYICEATNSLGSAEQTVTLKRAMPPGPPVVRIPVAKPTKVTLEVDAPRDDGGQPLTGFHYSYYPAADRSSAVEKDIDSTYGTTSINLIDLKPDTPYVVNVHAKNPVGLSQATSVSFQTKEVSSPLKLDIRSPSEGPEPTSYTLTWSQPDDVGSPITQYVIRYRRVQATGDDPSKWEVTGDIDKTYTTKTVTEPDVTSYTLTDLQRGTYYDVRITAINKQGESPEAFKIIKTSQGPGKGTDGSVSLTVNVTSVLLLLTLACLSALW